MMGNISTSSTFDSSFRLELVPLPVWSNSRTEPGKDEKHTHNFHEEEEKKDNLLFGRRKRRSGGSERLAPNILLEKDDPQKLPMVADIIRELRSTDNILVTEIGKKGLLEYIQQGLMASSTSGGGGNDDDHRHHQTCPCHSVCDWELQDEGSFRYLMELLQANMIYFLKRRYFDLERCRYHHTKESHYHHHETTGHHHQLQHEKNRSSSIAEDFKTIFDKASSSRYLSNREQIAIHCFRKPYQKKRGGAKKATPRGGLGLSPQTIQKALVRLHRRAGIYLPPTGARSHPSSYSVTASNYCHNNASMEDGVDAYWIDLWRVCSSLLVWILEPCLEITRSLAAPPVRGSPFDHHYAQGDSSCPHHTNHEKMRRSTDQLYHTRDTQHQQQQHQQQHHLLPPPNKKRRIIDITDDDPAGFVKQSHRISRIPFDLIRTEAQRVGLFYDRVLLHDGLWDEEIDEDYVCSYSDSDSDNDGDGDGDDEEDDDDNDNGNDDKENDDNDSDIADNAANVSGEENGSKGKGQNQGERKGANWNGNGKDRRQPTGNDDDDDDCDDRDDVDAMAMYNSFWADET
jgi:hypothetical protein